MGVIIINPYFQIGGVSPPSNLYSEDNVGNGASGIGNSRVTLTDAVFGVQQDFNLQNPIEVQAGDTPTLDFNGQMTGTPVSFSWTVTAIDNFAGLITGTVPNTGTAVNFSPAFSVNASANPGDMAVFEIGFEATNSGGTGTVVFGVTFIMP
mgnify:CR=1 FL=1